MILKCKMCGGDIQISPELTYGTCDSCGTATTLPNLKNENSEQKANSYNRANHFRLQNDFDKALSIYEKLIEEDSKDAEAHWCAVLCRFGIEYVTDPTSQKRVPTCHRASYDSILKDIDYLATIQNTQDEYTKSLYQQEANYIAEVQKSILAISQNETPFDVFICYKETDPSGNRTVDSTIAQEIYYQLNQSGYKVFFARITLEDKLGQAYEPYIFAALNSAKVMLSIGTKAEYFNATWVKNEWSRYLLLMKNDHSRLLIPCYKDMDAYEIPEELAMLQSQDMSKIGFLQDLIRGIDKVLSGQTNPQEARNATSDVHVIQQATDGTEPLLKRAFIFLEDKDWKNAEMYFDRVLDLNPEHAEAYIGKFCAEFNLNINFDLGFLTETQKETSSFTRAKKYGSVILKEQESIWETTKKQLDLEGRLYPAALEKLSLEQIEAGVFTIKDEVLEKYEEKNEIVVTPKGIKRIQRKAFYFTGDKIESLYVSEGVEFIERQALGSLRRLKELFLPSTLRSLEGGAITGACYHCAALESVRLPENLETLGEYAFGYCSKLENMVIPTSVKFIGSAAFLECTRLETVTLPEYITIIPAQLFSGCKKLKHIEIPKTVTEIGKSAFYHCDAFTNIIIPESVTLIKKDAFGMCKSLTSVTITSQDTFVEKGAFSSCNSLTEVIIQAESIKVEKDAFKSTPWWKANKQNYNSSTKELKSEL